MKDAAVMAKAPQSRADELEERLVDFAVRIVKLSARLPRTPAGRHMAGQILRSGTSPAPNYGEARSAESDADFVHKLSIVLKELNETRIWLKVMVRGGLMAAARIAGLQDENGQLAKIISTSIKTVRKRRERTK